MAPVLTLQHPDGTTLTLNLMGASPRAITSATQSIELCGTDTVALQVISTTPIAFQIGDRLRTHGKTYTLQQAPRIERTADRQLRYTLTLEGEQYLLLNAAFQLPFSVSNQSYTGTLADFANLIIQNLNRLQPSQWMLVEVPSPTETKTLTLEDTNCLDALQQMCNEWKVEYQITHNPATDTYTLALRQQIGTTITAAQHTFAYGQQGILTQITQAPDDDQEFATRTYYYGGTTNIPNDYFNQRQSNRLCLPYRIIDTTSTPNPQRHQSYIQQTSASQRYGLVERVVTFDDIYPNRIGTVTAIYTTGTDPWLRFTDSTMFDLTARDSSGQTLYLIPGTSARVHFNTGMLAGYDFDISAYDHATRTFTINPITDENNYTYPSPSSSAFRIAVGDEYIITDITLPQSYLDQAALQLQQQATEHYQQHSAPAITYAAVLDPLATQRLAPALADSNDTILHIGDTIHITDAALALQSEPFRIIALQRDLLLPHAYTIKISRTNTIRSTYLWSLANRVLPAISTLRRRLRQTDHTATQSYYISDQMRQRTTNLEHTTDTLSTITTQQQQRIATITSDLQTTEQATEENAQAIQTTSRATQDNALAIHENRNTLAQQGQTIASHQETLTFHEQRIAYLEAHLPK